MSLSAITKPALASVAAMALTACQTLEPPQTFTGMADVTPVVTEHSFGLQCLGTLIEESDRPAILIDVDRIRDRTIPTRLNDRSRLSQAGEWLVHTAVSKLETDKVRSTIGGQARRNGNEPAFSLTGAWTQDDELLRRTGGLLDVRWLRGRAEMSGDQRFEYIAGDFVSSREGIVTFSTAIGVAIGSRQAEAKLLVEDGNEFAEIGFESRWADGPQLAQRRIAEAATLIHVAQYFDIDYRPCLETGWADPEGFRASLASYASMQREERNYTAQVMLASLGHDPGVMDGLWGPASRRALMAFQVEQDLPVTGQLSPVVYALLEARNNRSV